jgi:hypothetical protein
VAAERRQSLRGLPVTAVGFGGRQGHGEVSTIALQLVRSGCGRIPAPSGWGAPDRPSQVHGDPDGGGLGDGRVRLWNPPFDLLPVVLKKIEDDRERGVLIAPRWPAQPWYGRLRRLASRMLVLDPADTAGSLTGQRALNPEWELVVAEIRPSRTGALPSEILS